MKLKLALLLAALAAPFGHAAEGWCFTQPGDDPVPITGARYEVELFGPVARGQLVVTLANPGEEDRVAALYGEPAGRRFGADATIDAYAQGSQALELTSGVPTTGRYLDVHGKRSVARRPAQPPLRLPIEAGGSVELTAAFTGLATFVEGTYRLTLPPVVTNCTPGKPSPNASVVPTAGLWRVFDEEPSIHIESATHAVFANFQGDHTRVELSVPNDRLEAIQLAYALTDRDEPALDAFNAADDELVLVLSPPAEVPDLDDLRAKEVVFVVDTSGSMRGPKIASVQEALVLLLQQLADDDELNVIEFNSLHTALFEETVAAGSYGRSSADSWIRGLVADGSTKLMPALIDAVGQVQSDEHHGMVIVLTDGRLGDTEAVEAFIAEHVDCERLFFVGTGEQDRERIEHLAQISRGLALFADEPEQLAQTLEFLFNQVSAPYAWDLELDAGEATIVESSPNPLPDLYAGRPVTLNVKLAGPMPDVIQVHGQTVDGPRTFTLEVAGRDFPTMPALPKVERKPAKKTTVTRNAR